MSDIFERTKGRLKNKIKNDPFPAIGMLGFGSLIAYSIFHYRKKDPSLKPSVYVIQTRVAAQGIAIATITMGLIYHMYKEYKNRNIFNPNELSRPNEITPSTVEKVFKK